MILHYAKNQIEMTPEEAVEFASELLKKAHSAMTSKSKFTHYGLVVPVALENAEGRHFPSKFTFSIVKEQL